MGLGLIVVSACNSRPVTADDSNEATQEIHVQLTTNPDTPRVGNVELALSIKDQNGQPVEGALVNITADHIDMSGMIMSGLATDQGGGIYAITADFSMSGNWKINVNVSTDEKSIEMDIPLIIH